MSGRADTADNLPHPRQATELLGHSAAEAVLMRAWTSGRLPHAWLITGPRGIGKATLAYRFARFALAGGADDGGLFGGAPSDLGLESEHPVARQVAAGGHPDLFVLQPGMPHPEHGRPAKEILVGHVRKAVHFCFMTPASAAWRVVIVDPADDMNPNAANALLKVLEEPPRQALLLLVSHAPARLLPTIRSRCSQLPLPGLEEATVRELLSRHVPDLEPDDAAALARLAEGSVGRAVELSRAGGLELYRDMVALLGELPGAAPQRLHDFADRLSQGGESGAFRLGGDLLAWWLARLVRAGASGRIPDEVVAGEGQVMQRLLAGASLERWLDLWDKVTRQFGRAERVNFDRKQVLLTVLLEVDALAT